MISMVESTWGGDGNPWAWPWTPDVAATVATSVGVVTAIVTALIAGLYTRRERLARLTAERRREKEEAQARLRAQATQVVAWIVVMSWPGNNLGIKALRITVRNNSDMPVTDVRFSEIMESICFMPLREPLAPNSEWSFERDWPWTSREEIPEQVRWRLSPRSFVFEFTDASGRRWRDSRGHLDQVDVNLADFLDHNALW